MLPSVNGEEWKRQRSIMTPTFSSGKIKAMFGLMSSCVDSMEKSLMDNLAKLQSIKSDQPILELDVKSFFGKYTMDVIAKCCFATETKCHEDSNVGKVFYEHASTFFGFTFFNFLKLILLPLWVKEWIQFTIHNKDGIQFFSNVTRELLKQRRSQMQNEGDAKSAHIDFLHLLMETGHEKHQDQHNADVSKDSSEVPKDSSEVSKDSSEVPKDSSEVSKDSSNSDIAHLDIASNVDLSSKRSAKFAPFTDTDIIANSIIFFAAGFETTATLLTYASYCLAMYQDVQEKLFQEIVRTCRESEDANLGANLDYDAIGKLQYLDCFVSEVLRIYTPVIRMPRVATADYMLEHEGREIFVPKGTPLNLAFYAVHHDPEYWEEAPKFDPDRFLPENRHKIKQFSFLPFGAGPRNCIGMRFALVEAKLAIARLVLKLKFVKCDKTDEILDFSEAFVLLHAKRVLVGVQKR